MMSSTKKNRWIQELQELETELRGLQRYPVSSIRPHHWKSIEELEERIRVLKERLQQEL